MLDARVKRSDRQDRRDAERSLLQRVNAYLSRSAGRTHPRPRILKRCDRWWTVLLDRAPAYSDTGERPGPTTEQLVRRAREQDTVTRICGSPGCGSIGREAS